MNPVTEIDQQKLDDILYRLTKSSFRSSFKLRGKERAYLQDKGLAMIVDHTREFIFSRLAAANPENDGRQTPMKNHPAFVAQHATATCCRGCMAKWHGIKKGVAMSEDEVAYVVAVIERWLQGQV